MKVSNVFVWYFHMTTNWHTNDRTRSTCPKLKTLFWTPWALSATENLAARLASCNTTSQFISTRWPTGRFLWMSNFCWCCIKVHVLLETQWNFTTHYDDDGETCTYVVCVSSHEPSRTAIFFLIFIIHINSFSCMLRLSRGQMIVLWYWKKESSEQNFNETRFSSQKNPSTLCRRCYDWSFSLQHENDTREKNKVQAVDSLVQNC